MAQTAAQYAATLLRTLETTNAADSHDVLVAIITGDVERLSEESKYNGWTNYETWLVNLHLTNDRGTYEAVNDLLNPGQFIDSETPTIDRIDALKEYVEMLVDVDALADGSGRVDLVIDLIRAALSEVNWKEIVEGWFE